MFGKIAKWFVLCIAASAVGGTQVPEQDLQTLLRLKIGNYWVYRGTVEWTYPSGPEEDAKSARTRFGKKHITWKSEIIEEVTRGEIKAFLVQGSVFDLPWYEPGTKPEQYLWVIYRNRFYSIGAKPEILARFHDPKDSLTTLIIVEEPVLQFPLRLNKCTVEVKSEEPRERDDLRYCWFLESKSGKDLSSAGLPPNAVDVWTACYQTIPSHEVLGFAPTIGFVSFDFSHHGTLAEAHVKLVEVHLQ